MILLAIALITSAHSQESISKQVIDIAHYLWWLTLLIHDNNGYFYSEYTGIQHAA